MMRKTLGILGLALALAWPALSYAASEDLVGLWNMAGDAGTMELKDDGSFETKVKDGTVFAGKWAADDTTLTLTKDGKDAKCTFALAEDKLTFSDCPIAGEYTAAEQ